MSGYVPRKVSNARMRTKTNQTGLKMQGSASMLGRRGYIQRYVNRRVQTGFGVDGYPTGYRCINGVDPVTASDEAKECNCYYARDITINQVILAPAPKNQGLAGGVGRINVPRFGCNVTCSASPNDHPHFNPPGPPEPPKPNPLCKNKKVNPPNSPKMKFVGCSDGGKEQTLEFSWDSLSGDKCVHYLQILMNGTVIVDNIKKTKTTHTQTFECDLLVDSNKFSIKSIGFFNQFSTPILFAPSSYNIGCLSPLTPKNFKCGSIKYPFSIDLSWDDNDDIPPKRCTTYYKITYTPQGTDGKSSQQVTKIQGEINQSTTIHNLAPNKAYQFTIQAFNNNTPGASPTPESAIECKTSDKQPLSDKLNLTFWWQITNSNGNIWDTNAPKSGNNFQKLVGYYLSFLNYTHHTNLVSGQKSVIKRVTFLIQNPGIPNKSYMRRTDNNAPIQFPLAPEPSIIQGKQYVPYDDTATGTVPLLEFFVKSCFKMFKSWGIPTDDDEFPQVGFIVDMGEPWQFYGLQNGTADNYTNYDSRLGDYWYRGPEGIRYYDKTGQFQGQDTLKKHPQPPTIPGFVPDTDNKLINVCPTAYQVFRYISDLNHILESDPYTSANEKMRISFLIADIEGGGTAGLTGESDIIKFTTDPFKVKNDIQKGQKVRQTLNSDRKNGITDGILAVALSADTTHTEIYVQPKKASVPFSQKPSTLKFLATSSFDHPQPPVPTPNPIDIQSLSEGSLISNSNYMDCLMAHFSKDQPTTEVTLPSDTGRPDVFGIQNQRIAEVSNTKALPRNFSWGFTSSIPKFAPSTLLINKGRVGPMLGAPEFYNLSCGSFCEEGWDVGGYNGLGVDCMVCPESKDNPPQIDIYPNLDPSCNKFIAKTGFKNSRYLQYRNKSYDLFTKAGFKDKLNNSDYFKDNQAQFLPMFSIENKRSINTSDPPRPGDKGCLVNSSSFTDGPGPGIPCKDNSCGIGDFFGVWDLDPFYDYLHYISNQSESYEFKTKRDEAGALKTGKYSFAVYDCGLLPVEWIQKSQTQPLDTSVLTQLGFSSPLPQIQP